MFLRILILLASITPSQAAVSSQPEKINKFEEIYRSAADNFGSSQSCKKLSKLANEKDFTLRSLAKLRNAQYCEKNPQWEKLAKQFNDPVLKKVLNRSWFEYERDKKRFGNAYLVYNKNRKAIPLDKKEFEKLAQGALKTRLSKKDKNALRKELRRRSPRYLPNPRKKDFLRVARDFRNDRQFEKALIYYRKVINDPQMTYHQRWHAFKGARLTYKLERWTRMKKYIKSSKQWANFLRDKYKWSKEMTRLHHDANIEYIRTLWTEKGQNEARKELNRLEKEIKGRHTLQLVYWLKGRMFEERKDFKSAVIWLEKAAKEKNVSGRDYDRVLWALAWNQRRTGQFKDSQATLEKLKKSRELTFFSKTKYLYWQAENKESMGKKSEAKKSFKALAELDLYGYYGALAYRKLGQTFPTPPMPEVESSKILSFFQPKDRNYFNALVNVGELEIAEEFTAHKVKTKKSWSTDKWVSYLNLLQRSGAYKTSFIRYHTLPPKKQLEILEEHPYLLFPRPFPKEVESSAKITKVSPALIYSIMKQESGFDVKARSHADAFGLLQLIPEVAQKAAKRMPSVGYKEPYDLYKPEVIIPLGSNNLNHLFSKFDSNFILSVASYNASERAVRGWVKSRFQGDPITFIEDIPYEETKGYVKLVMRNYIAYNRFASKQDDFVFPEVCLQGLQSFKK